MSTVYFIETLNNNGDVHSRQQCTTLPIRIGRAYHNEIILDDPHSSAEHAVIDTNETGELTIRNINSQNGIRLKGKRANEFIINGDAIFHLGHTQLRIRTNDYVVAPEIIDEVNHRWDGWPLAIIAVFMISFLAFGNTWVSDIENNKTTPYIINICMWIGYSMLWAGIWAVANRVFGGTAHFSRHLLILGCGLTSLFLWGYVAIIFAYGFSWTLLTRFGNHIEIIIIAFTIYHHLHQVMPRKHKRVRIVCAVFAILCSGLVLMKNYQSSDQYADELYMHEILPPSVRFSRNYNLDEFNVNISQLKKEIDKEREKAIKEK